MFIIKASSRCELIRVDKPLIKEKEAQKNIIKKYVNLPIQ